MQYIWQKPDWPQFVWNEQIIQTLVYETRKKQTALLAQIDLMQSHDKLEARAQIMTEEALQTSAIEGHLLDRQSVRSSVYAQLGIPQAGLPSADRYTKGLVEVLQSATQSFNLPLTSEDIQSWHTKLFSGVASSRILVGGWRTSETPMQVVSGAIGKEKVHFEAPPASRVPWELEAFIAWWQKPSQVTDGIVRAGIAHLYFVTIHPFDDGNGRISRVLTDLAMAQDEQRAMRCYSLSAQIVAERSDYYAALEQTQKGTTDITSWLQWFLGSYTRAILRAQGIINNILTKSTYWSQHGRQGTNERQRKVLGKLLDAGEGNFEGGLTNRKYVAMTDASRATAYRDLDDLVRKGMLVLVRGTRRDAAYDIAWPTRQD